MELRRLILVCGLVLSGHFAGDAAAVTNNWKLAANGKWELGANWSAGVPSSLNDVNVISNGTTKTITMDAVTVLSNSINGCLTISNLVVTAPAGAVNTLLLTNTPGATLRVLDGALFDTRSTLLIRGGALEVDGVAGDEFDIDGTAFLLSGSIIGTNVFTAVGAGGTGSLTVSNGTLSLRDAYCAFDTGTRGTLTAAGGTCLFSQSLDLGVESAAIGTVWVNGGTFILTNGSAFIGDSGSGRMTVSNGTVLLKDVYVALDSNQGSLTMAGGTNQLVGALHIATLTASLGTVLVTGGSLTQTNGTATVGEGAAGQMVVSNAIWLARDVAVGSASGSQGGLTVGAGTNTLSSSLSIARSAGSTGAVWVTGGQFMVTNGTTFIGLGGVGQMTVSNGTTLFQQMIVASNTTAVGALTVTGGTNSIWSGLLVGARACASTGTVTLAGGSLCVTNATGTAVLEVRSGTFTMNGGTVLVDKLIVTNACARFIRTGGTLTVGSLVLDPAMDADGDGLPNGWEQANGLDPLTPSAGDDPDGDGLSNAQEFALGTNPNDNQSPFHVTAIAREGSDIRITWMTVGGKTNFVQATSDLASSFTNISPAIIIAGSGVTTTNYLDVGGVTNIPSRFYRVRLVP